MALNLDAQASIQEEMMDYEFLDQNYLIREAEVRDALRVAHDAYVTAYVHQEEMKNPFDAIQANYPDIDCGWTDPAFSFLLGELTMINLTLEGKLKIRRKFSYLFQDESALGDLHALYEMIEWGLSDPDVSAKFVAEVSEPQD